MKTYDFSKLKQLNLFSNEAQTKGFHICSVRSSFDLYVEEIKKLGYSVLIRNSGSKKIIRWSTTTHWASASFVENSEDDLIRVCKRLKETVYNVSSSNAR